jgi:hypothetical protein
LAVPAVRAQRPVGYSKYYRRYLLEGISLVLRREPGLVATLSEDVGKLAASIVNGPDAILMEVDQTVSILEELQLERKEFRQVLEAIAFGPRLIAIAARDGSDAQTVREVQKRAIAALDSVVSIK